jgi:hypothetical protein
MSRLASNAVRTKTAYAKFEEALKKAEDAQYRNSLKPLYNKIKKESMAEQQEFDRHVKRLISELEDLKQELDIAKILSSMSQVEAAQANPEHQAALKDNALNIGQAAVQIEQHVVYSLSLFSKF